MKQSMQVLTSRDSVEWFTPESYIQRVFGVLGGIDLDPCCDHRAPVAQYANNWYAIDGLQREWFGDVFVNPPYSETQEWIKHTEICYDNGDIDSAILLVNSNLGYKWYESLYILYPTCLVRERISFIREDGFVGQSKKASSFIYLGNKTWRFVQFFSDIGRILLP